MKQFRICLFIPLVLFFLSSCVKGYLDKAPSVNLPEDSVFNNPVLTGQYADNAYNFMVNDYARMNDHRGISGQAADEAVSGNNDVSIRTLSLGTYHDHYERGGEPLDDIRGVYTRMYGGIRITNLTLEKIDAVNFPADSVKNRIKGEMYFLRAYFYAELIKRFGGVIIIDKAYGANDDLDFPRSTYEQCLNFILSDLDRAVPLLEIAYNSTNNGRATKGAALALKARVLLYAASKLNNESNDPGKWLAAANAARAVMDLNQYSLQPTYADLLNVAPSPEYIMIKIRGPRTASDGRLLDFAMSPGSGGSQGSLNPTQNHVDLYEMQATGRSITDAASGYSATAPYAGRDPRFYANILYNNADWQGRKIQMWNGGLDYLENNIIYTATRYYCRKMWPEPYIRNTSGTALINYIFFRYGEVLLNYAEAKNEIAAGAPDIDSVLSAINLVRIRAGMPLLQTANATAPGYVAPTKDALRIRIRNERAVELAFEDHRWYDIQRWKAGPEIVAQPMYGMNVVRVNSTTFTYTKVLLPQTFQKVFLDYMHRYPIPRSEVYKSKGILQQNPGW